MKFDTEWTAVDALFYIFCTDMVLDSDASATHDVIEKIIRKLFAEQVAGESGVHPQVPAQNLTTIRNSITAMKKAMPGITANSIGASLMWAHWAYNDSAVNGLVSRYFLRQLLKFSTPLKTDELTLIQIFTKYKDQTEDKWRGTKRKEPGFEGIFGTTLGRFFRQKKFVYNRRILELRIKKVAIQENESEQKRRRKRKSSPKREAATHCGKTLLNVTRECVKKAANARNFRALELKTTTDDRYICTVTRTTLLSQLRARYKCLQQYKESSLRRALSALVACPKGRPPH
jgi:hypothetical protein